MIEPHVSIIDSFHLLGHCTKDHRALVIYQYTVDICYLSVQFPVGISIMNLFFFDILLVYAFSPVLIVRFFCPLLNNAFPLIY